MLARCVTRLESRAWPASWRETCSTSVPANVPRETSASPQSVATGSGPGALEARQRVRPRAGDDPDRHGAAAYCCAGVVLTHGALAADYARSVLAALIDIPPNVGYAAIFALIAVETMGIPVPGETALIAAALLAHDGQLDIVLAVRRRLRGGDHRRQRRLRDRPQGRAQAVRAARAVPRAPAEGARARRAVLRQARAEGGVPRALGVRPADRLRVAGGHEQDVVADVPVLERARRDRVGDAPSRSASTSSATSPRTSCAAGPIAAGVSCSA